VREALLPSSFLASHKAWLLERPGIPVILPTDILNSSGVPVPMRISDFPQGTRPYHNGPISAGTDNSNNYGYVIGWQLSSNALWVQFLDENPVRLALSATFRLRPSPSIKVRRVFPMSGNSTRIRIRTEHRNLEKDLPRLFDFHRNVNNILEGNQEFLRCNYPDLHSSVNANA